MPYKFIEKSYMSDPNLDLNFGNDILYSDLTNDELSRYDTDYSIKPSLVSNVKPLQASKKNKQKHKESSKMMYLVFIFIIVMIVLLWYYFNNNDKKSKKSPIEDYYSNAELVMMSPKIKF